jgi:NAD(P)-dependent dehydrogenase (short-subunit alcohol dehydrogenase family)
MVAAGWGRVIQISSAVAVQPNNLGSDYSGAKAALNNFTVSLAGSLKGVGVTVNTVSPGVIMVDGIPYPNGVIRAGTVAGQHYEWTAWVDGAPLVVYHFYWTMGDNIEPKWDNGDSCYRVVVAGNPPLELRLMGGV